MRREVLGHFLGDIGDAIGQLHHHVDGGVLFLELLPFAFRQVRETFVKLRIQLRSPQLPVSRARLPVQWQRRSVADRIGNRITRLQISLILGHAGIVRPQFAAKRARRVVIVQLDRRAGEAEQRRILEHVAHRRAEIAFLRAMSLIHQHDDVTAIHLEIARLELLHDRDDDAAEALAQLLQQIHAADRDAEILRPGVEELAAELVFKLLAIDDDKNGRLPKGRVKPHLAGGEQHGQALA